MDFKPFPVYHIITISRVMLYRISNPFPVINESESLVSQALVLRGLHNSY
jgi:hypothetical protein